ncbi:nuclear transport factor 2 family protein [Roseococcus sp. YIM B11640]|uniref:nuclear transport factor 2 family protein n=1 Tax=Roseococcus sp. YIM B11640 TaxID=3133973 RepID=UPI003C7E89BE
MPSSPQAVIESFAANFLSRDAAKQAALFHEDASFFGSSVPGLLRGPEGALGYFRKAWAEAAPGVMTCEELVLQPIAPDLSLFAATCRLARPGRISVLRASGAIRRADHGWRFASLHVSAAPPES